MEAILEHISEANYLWVQQLQPKDVAFILDAVAEVPNIVNVLKNTKSYSETAALKGKQAETEFSEIVKDLPSNYKVISSAKIARSGDFIIEYTSISGKSYRILIDIKNYNTTVPYKEVLKFFDDLDTNASMSSGIILSYYSRFANFSNSFTFGEKYLPSGTKPYFVLNSSQNNIIKESIFLLCKYLEMNDIQERKCYQTEYKIKHHIAALNQTLDYASKARKSLITTKETMSKNIDLIYRDLLELEVHASQHLRNISSELSTQKPTIHYQFINSIPKKNQLHMQKLSMLNMDLEEEGKFIKMSMDYFEFHLQIMVRKIKIKVIRQPEGSDKLSQMELNEITTVELEEIYKKANALEN